MAYVGLVRVSTDRQEVQRQHDALDPICVRVFEETISGTKKAAERPGLQAALDYLREGDLLTVQEVGRLGRNLLEGLLVLSELFERGVTVRILDGIAAGEHTGQRALAGAVGSHDGVNLTGVHRQGDALENVLVVDAGL